MNRKLIKRILHNRISQWLKTIKDDKVRELASKNTILSGGAIASLLLKEKVKDYDLYFRDKETCLAIAEYYCKEFNQRNDENAIVLDGERDLEYSPTTGKSVVRQNSPIADQYYRSQSVMVTNCTPDRVKILLLSKGVAAEKKEILDQPFEDVFDVLDTADETPLPDTSSEAIADRFRPVFLSSNAITLSDQMQLVIRFYGEVEEIHKNYDFVHCTNSYDYHKEELILRPEAMEALMAKELKYIGSKYPFCSIVRTRKFIKRGFTCNAGQYLKMCFQVSKLDLTNVDVLEDQLVGVDSAYFQNIIYALHQKTANDPNFQLDESYLMTIVDRIF